ncbi:CHAP domain-containing protein [Arcanobacterium hippocoleae]
MGKPGNMPGWKRVKTPDEIRPGDVISYSQGVYGSHPLYGHVAYVAENDGQKIVVENYGYAQYYLTEHDYASLRKWLKSGSVVVVQNPELTGEKRKAIAAKNTTGDKS